MNVSAFEKFLLVVSFVIFALAIVALASPEWLQKDVEFPAFFTKISLKLGLFELCQSVTSPNPTNFNQTVTTEKCGGDGADDWQVISAGLAIAAMGLSTVSTILACLHVFVVKIKGNMKIKYILAICHFLTAGCLTAVLILYIYNDNFLLPAPFSTDVTMDLSWGYFVACAAGPLSAILMLVIVINIILNTKQAESVNVGHSPMFDRSRHTH